MPKIQDLATQYNTDKDTIAKAYKTVVGKALPARAATIKDEERALIEPTLKSAKIGKPTDEPKVFKATEVGFGDDFLAGLGFGPKDDEPVEDEELIDDIFNTAPPVVVPEEPAKPSFGNARVIGSEPMPERPARGATRGERPAFKKRDGIVPPPRVERTDKPESETKGKTFYSFGTAPAFSTGQYKNKPHTRPQAGGNRQAAAPKTPTTPAAPRVQREAATSGTLVKKQEIIIGDTISVKEFSEKMGVTFPELMKKFMANKILVNINSTIDFDTANIIGEEFGVKVKKETGSISIEDMMSGNLNAILAIDKEAEHTLKRPPVVTIMGHVDHGKTKLLDYLRKTNIISGEAGGITQSIGASQVEYNGEKITFIDTPGHELFTSLRARGAKVTNIVVIVIAIDDGIKQQTVEAIKHALGANVPIIVAVTKIDKGHLNNLDNIKTQMAEHGLTAEDWGGDVPVIPLSAVSGEGVDDLLDRILLQSEMLELAYNPNRNAVGVVLEVTKDPKQGILTSLLLMSGTMKVGDIIMIHNTYGKVRKMTDWTGKNMKVAHGGDPVMILGMQDIPEPGRVAEVTDTERQAQERIAAVIDQEKSQKDGGNMQAMIAQMANGEMITTLNVIVKADSYGSLEAVKYSLASIPAPENMVVKVIHSDVGTFGEADIALAHAAGAIILGFNVPIPASIVKKAQTMHVNIKTYDIIYEMNDYIDGILKGMIVIEEKEVIIGKLNILAIFFKKEKEMIIGGKVLEGETRNGAMFRVWRKGEVEEEVIAQGRITSLQRGQDNVNTVTVGHECGMKVRTSKKILEGDTLEFYVME